MLPQHTPVPQSPRRIGVGIDTSRYGHYDVFLTDDLQPADSEADPRGTSIQSLDFLFHLRGLGQRVIH